MKIVKIDYFFVIIKLRGDMMFGENDKVYLSVSNAINKNGEKYKKIFSPEIITLVLVSVTLFRHILKTP